MQAPATLHVAWHMHSLSSVPGVYHPTINTQNPRLQLTEVLSSTQAFFLLTAAGCASG